MSDGGDHTIHDAHIAATRHAAQEQVITTLCAQVGRLALRVVELERLLAQAQSVAIGRIEAVGPDDA